MTYLRRPALFILLAMLSLAASAVTVRAENSATITDAQLVQIRGRCSEIKATLGRVHANDALLRVNRGQLYELISTKLMARLNSRIALNRLDSSSLVDVVTKYEQHLREFRNNYQSYEVSLSDTLKINCTDQPTNFYESLQDARSKRALVHKSTQNITKDVKAYRTAFYEFRKTYKEDLQ